MFYFILYNSFTMVQHLHYIYIVSHLEGAKSQPLTIVYLFKTYLGNFASPTDKIHLLFFHCVKFI